MKIFVRYALLTALACNLNSLHAQNLWYRQPAAVWTDALPIGNGRLGAMIYGGAGEEHLQFNEASLWTGLPREYARPGAVQYLQPIRQLLAEGKQEAAEDLAEQHFMGLKYPDDSTYKLQYEAWTKKVRQQLQFAAPDFNDAAWPTMMLPTPDGWERLPGLMGADGAVWFRTSFTLPVGWQGKNLVLDLGRIRDIDYSYVNGQFVGQDEGIAKKRRYTIPAALLKPGKNTVAVQVINYFDKGGFTGVKSNKTFVVYPEGGNGNTEGVALENPWKYFIQDDAPPMYPTFEADYQPFGDLFIRQPQVQQVANYKRELDLNNALHTISYTSNGIAYKREYLASAPHQCIALHYTAGKAGAISLQAVLHTPHQQYVIRKLDAHTLSLSIQVSRGVLKGVGYLYATATGGTLNISDTAINVQKANEVTFYLVAATSFKNYKDVSGDPVARCNTALQRIKNLPFAAIKQAHIKEYQQYFNTFSIAVPAGKNSALPTDERIQQFNMQDDAALTTLYLQYGRYLLISSSRPGTQAANLQGIWNDLLTPPWGSKYTTNINLEMNYWPAEVLHLSRCAQPLFATIDELAQTGAVTAREHYGAPGWVLHHNTDQWRGTAPINASNHGIWVTGAAWLCLHLWEHFQFTQDTAFLRQQYPVMKAAADFFVHFLVKDPATGYLISTPSNSPEQGGLVAGPTMDHQIIRELFRNCSRAAAILKTDDAFAQTLTNMATQIAPNQIGKHHQLQEWMEDKDDPANQHRHISHLWGVFPGTDITWKDSALMKAARQSLLYRGDGGTGWSLAWKVNVWARFKDGDHSLLILKNLLQPAYDKRGVERGGVYNNLFDAHPPFQIDGNFGGAAGIAEMLVQSHTGVIELLPALPTELPDGEVKGICARGGFVLNIKWHQHQLQQVMVTSTTGNLCTLKYGTQQIQFATKKNGSYTFNGDLKK